MAGGPAMRREERLPMNSNLGPCSSLFANRRLKARQPRYPRPDVPLDRKLCVPTFR